MGYRSDSIAILHDMGTPGMNKGSAELQKWSKIATPFVLSPEALHRSTESEVVIGSGECIAWKKNKKGMSFRIYIVTTR